MCEAALMLVLVVPPGLVLEQRCRQGGLGRRPARRLVGGQLEGGVPRLYAHLATLPAFICASV